MTKKLVWPDYDNCLANVPNSILKKFGCEPEGKTLPMLDRYLEKDYKNVVTVLLDGMGKSVLEKLLKEDGPFRSHLAGIYNSTFPSTTANATTSALSGLQPCEHCWLGWECYFPQIDKNVVLFYNTIQGTEEQAADFDVASTFNPYEDIVTKIMKNGGKAYGVASFLPPYIKSIDELCDGIRNACAQPGNKYIYAYWEYPDKILHKYGNESDIVRQDLQNIEEKLNSLIAELEDTIVIITADHGHIDNEIVHIQDYPKIMDCLVRLPSLEPRALNLFVKEDRKAIFEEEFQKEFGDKFLLLTMEEALERKVFGTEKPGPNFMGMLGNYLAIATDSLTIYFTDEEFMSHHGSLTEDEMLIPLIVFEKK